MTKIFFLEDEPTILEVTCEYMRMQEYEVVTAVDGQAALEILTQEKFDVAILDIMVPHVGGLEVLEYLHKNQPQTATIMLTALADEQTQIKAFNLFADDYVVKPFSPILLLKRIEAVLRRGTHADEINQHGIIVDDLSYQAYYDGQSLQLTLTEFLIMQTLFMQPKRVLTREQLLNRIFPDDYFANDRIIDAHIKNLRKKLPLPYVKTITGVGYQLNMEVE